VRFRILGPMAVHDGRHWVGIGAAKWRSLLAALLIRATDVVSFDQLVYELWGDTPPRTAATQVHGYVMRVRRAIGDPQGHRLVTAAPGYRLVVGADDVDARRFGVLLGAGREALDGGDARRAADLLGEALDLWRGPALSDVAPTAPVRAEADRLAEQWLEAWETRVDADLACGRHPALIGELQRHVEEHPLRERPWRALMLALHRSGRRAEALQTFQRLRRTLVDELGVEPCATSQQLHQRILTDCGALDGLESPARDGAPVHQLPVDLPDFTGRAEQLESIARTLTGGTPDGSPPIVVVVGCPGAGKSTLAVHAAHVVRAEFPDGQLYLDLAATTGEPRDPAVMLAELLSALGVTGSGIPDGVHARATLYRSMLAGRRIVILLDDAARADQIRPLLPPTGGCAVLVTGRRLLTDLPSAVHIELDVFRRAEARQLLASVAGGERVAREPAEAEGILRSCGYLPLAIRIAGGKLAGRPAWSLRVLNERLADESRRLSELRLGDLGVRASFDLSLRALPDDAVRAFRLLGLLGAQTVPGWVVGPLLGRANADDVLDALVDANLVQLSTMDAHGQPRYRLHDLLRAYAIEGATTIPARQRRMAVRRVLSGWLNLAEQAIDRLPMSFFEPTGRMAVAGSGPLRFVGDPLTWFDAERAALLGAVRLAVDWGMQEVAWRLAAISAPYYDLRALNEDWHLSHTMALPAVRAAGDRQGEANLLRGLAQVSSYRDNPEGAVDLAEQSLRLFVSAGDEHGRGLSLAALSSFNRVRGHLDAALNHAKAALDLVAGTGDQRTEAYVRCCVARIRLEQGYDDEARLSFENALALSRRIGDAHREGVVLRAVSMLYGQRGEFAKGLDCVRQALRIFESLADERCTAFTLLNTGQLYAMLGDRRQAAPVLERAAAFFRRSRSLEDEAKCLRVLEKAGFPAGPLRPAGKL
jgi:DNA-binding SARP family transcriptional activator/tetratricopeptide (TPR) repeat protein